MDELYFLTTKDLLVVVVAIAGIYFVMGGVFGYAYGYIKGWKEGKDRVMSADNGYILSERRDGKYTLMMFVASADEMPDPEKAEPHQTFDTMEDAERDYHRISHEPCFICEYGLSISLIPKETPTNA